MKNSVKSLSANGSERLKYIESAKGIGIFLVLIGHHIKGGPALVSWINSFHMPLFFIITGWLDCIRPEGVAHGSDLWSYAKKKAKSLLWPYCTFSAINLLWLTGYYLFFGVQPEEPFPVVWIKMITTYGYHALWFLPAMFCASVINRWAGRIAPKMTLTLSLVMASGISLYLECFTEPEILWYILIYIGRVSIAVSYVGLGKLFFHFLNRLRTSRAIVLACICFAVHLLLFRLVPQQNMSLAKMTNIPLSYLLGCVGSIGVILLCKHLPLLSNNRILSYASRNSLIILALHMDVSIELAWMVLGIAGFSAVLSMFQASVIAVGIECVILWGCIICIRKFLPFLLRFPEKQH